jgi:hypothetical protein
MRSTALLLLCAAIPMQGCAPYGDAPLMREIRDAAGDDYRFHEVDLHTVYGPVIPTADKVIDDLRSIGFDPTFADSPIGELEYVQCGQYYLSNRGGPGAHLRRGAFGDDAYAASLQFTSDCSVTGLQASRSRKNTL